MITNKLTSLQEKKIEEYKIHCRDENSLVSSLSGGNIQKVVVARELDNNPKVIIISQPTRGIDVGTAEIIRKDIIRLREQGSAILLSSSDLNEILEVCDKLIVLHKGKIVGYIPDTKEIDEMELGYYMLGAKKGDNIGGAIHNDKKVK